MSDTMKENVMKRFHLFVVGVAAVVFGGAAVAWAVSGGQSGQVPIA
jgi:uncharacterized membrane protein